MHIFLLIESDQVVVFYRKMFLYKHCINVDIEKKENIHANGFLNKKKAKQYIKPTKKRNENKIKTFQNNFY